MNSDVKTDVETAKSEATAQKSPSLSHAPSRYQMYNLATWNGANILVVVSIHFVMEDVGATKTA